jgi:hypothetical protein
MQLAVFFLVNDLPKQSEMLLPLPSTLDTVTMLGNLSLMPLSFCGKKQHVSSARCILQGFVVVATYDLNLPKNGRKFII